MRPRLLAPAAIATGAFLVTSLLFAPRATRAMPSFAEAYGVPCSTCHTMVPLLNSYGRYVQRTAYSSLDRATIDREIPVWVGESMNYDATAGSGTGTPRYSFGNLAIHGAGYAAQDVTFHAQQWITASDQSGGVDTLWVTYNNLLHRDGHLFVGKLENPAPSPYSQDFEIDGPSASATLVGEHDWGATYGNRWGTKLAYVKKTFDVEAGYVLSGDDLNGLTDFRAGDKTFQWKAAFARADSPFEAGLFGSNGSVPVSTGTDDYRSTAAYVQLDPGYTGRPGILAIYQNEKDTNPGVSSFTNLTLGATQSHGASVEVYEPFLSGHVIVGVRRDLNDDGAGTFANGNAVNVGFDIPGFSFAHGYLESNFGGNSALAGASGGPTWKGMLWLTIPIKAVH